MIWVAEAHSLQLRRPHVHRQHCLVLHIVNPSLDKIIHTHTSGRRIICVRCDESNQRLNEVHLLCN